MTESWKMIKGLRMVESLKTPEEIYISAEHATEYRRENEIRV